MSRANREKASESNVQIYFLARTIPELAALPPSERRIAWYACRKYVKGHWQTWVGTLFAVLAGLGAGWGCFYGITHLLEPLDVVVRYFVGGFVSGSVIVGVTEYLRGVVVNSQIRPYLRSYLAEREKNARPAPVILEYAEAPFSEENDN